MKPGHPCHGVQMSDAVSARPVPGGLSSFEPLELMVAEHIRHALIDGLIVILDLKVARYFLLDEVATSMWEGVVGRRRRSTLVDQIAAEFAVSHAQVEQDLDGFLRSCLSQGYLAMREASASPAKTRRAGRTARRLLALRAWWSLVTAWADLKFFGFQKLYARGVAEASIVRSEPLSVSDTLHRAEKAFLFAENFFVLAGAPRDCLPRSMAMFLFLRRLGLPARHQIGMERYPMSVHAWVECGARRVLDDPDSLRCTVLARIGA